MTAVSEHGAEFLPSQAAQERHETERKDPKATIFLLRHGESEEDKSKPNRGLTEKGIAQVREAVERIMDSLLRERNPDFIDWKNAKAKQTAFAQAAQDVEFHLRDSGTERTLQQVAIEYQALREAGVPERNIFTPRAVWEYMQQEPSTHAGPGVAKRLAGVQGLDANPEFRKKLKSKALQEEVGAESDVMTWALLPDDRVPEGVETRREMEERYHDDIVKAERVINAKTDRYDRRVVIIANSHASIATLAAAQELGIPLDALMRRIGEVPNAQGLRYDFYGSDRQRSAQPFGEDVEREVAKIREQSEA